MRIVGDLSLKCFVAEAQPAAWTVLDAVAQVPATTHEWERFIQEASALITGHRSIIGGGTWENKAGSSVIACRLSPSRACGACAARTEPIATGHPNCLTHRHR